MSGNVSSLFQACQACFWSWIYSLLQIIDLEDLVCLVIGGAKCSNYATTCTDNCWNQGYGHISNWMKLCLISISIKRKVKKMLYQNLHEYQEYK